MPQETTLFAQEDQQRIRHFCRLGVEIKTVYDIGASNGSWSAAMAEVLPEAEFDLFEPLIEHCTAYRESINPLLEQHPKWRLHKYAVGAKCGTVRFNMFPDPINSTALCLEWKCPGRQLPVPMITIDRAVQSLNLAVPQVLKVDTQGGELGVLEGAIKTLPRIDLVLLECWLFRGYGRATPLMLEVARFLREFDFHIWDFGGSYRTAEGVLCSRDTYFLNARSNISALKTERHHYN